MAKINHIFDSNGNLKEVEMEDLSYIVHELQQIVVRQEQQLLQCQEELRQQHEARSQKQPQQAQYVNRQ